MKKAREFLKYIVFGAIVIFLLLGLASMVSRIMLAIILIMIAGYIMKAFDYRNRPVVNGVFFLLVLNVIYYLFSSKTVHAYYSKPWETTGFLANIIMNLGVFFFSYFLSISNQISQKEVKWLFVAMFIACSIRFFVTRDTILIDNDGNLTTMNMAYDFVIMLPYLYLFRNRLLALAFIIPIAYYVAYCGKRGAILIYALAAIVLVYHLYLKNSKSVFLNVIIVVVAFMGVAYTMYIVYQESSLLQWRLEMTIEGNTSGRGNIYGAIWNAWLNSPNIIRLIFGYGFCASVEIAGNYAHCDWLELLSMSGLIGVVVYTSFFIQLFFFTRKKKNEDWQQTALYLILFIWITKSFFSMSYCSITDMPMTFLLGCLVGMNQWEKTAK